MTKDKQEMWVFIECFKNGKPKNIGLELLNEATKITKEKNIRVVAIILGNNIIETTKYVIYAKAEKVIYINNKNLEIYNTEAYVTNFYNLIKNYNPQTILIGATSIGRDMAPRLSARLKTGLTADCTKIEIEELSDNIIWTRPTFGGNLMAQIVCLENRPQMGTIRAGVFKKAELNFSNKGTIIEALYILTNNKIKLIEEFLDNENEEINLEEAKIIVSAGLGIKNTKGVQLVKELASELNASLGASRAVVDSNLISRIHQIGQTGKTVSPKIYIACGISGAIQHLVGMKTSDKIIAINSDEDAPIFSIADYKIVGDIFEIIPELINKIKLSKKD
ncbi:MAG TPA: electron transfer flavoprotein subunit alpha/FixB family protein [Clostridia bacterium]|nr:electron transfer flavoprotein subunit alpha/FixB family protein [Clostridia bacterium]